MSAIRLHTPHVRIITPAPTETQPFVPVVLSTVFVDREMWPVIAYRVEGDVDGIQQVTLTFHADLTVEHVPSEQTP